MSSMNYRELYRLQPARYDELVRAEDHAANLDAALVGVVGLRGRTVVEVGAGTGRLTRMLLRAESRVIATEREPAMLALAAASLRPWADRVRLLVADGRRLPLRDAIADAGIAGWVFGHFRSWMPDRWRDEIGAALDELTRSVRPGGTIVVIETLGTGEAQPAPPRPELAEYYAWLEHERGFRCHALRTDYRFESVEAAARVTGWFFGEAFGDRVRRERWTTVPECTGMWVRHGARV